MSLPLALQTKESATAAQLKSNIMTNLNLIEHWMHECYKVHDKTAHLISFGKSFRDNPQEMVEDLGAGDIFCVKHALPLFGNCSS